jgi:tetratricopeptide (TPR) repeat protein
LGAEVVTVALDIDPGAARPFVDAAAPTHPSLIDRDHAVDTLFGIVNVPNSVWIDEGGTIVRPAEPAFPGRSPVMERFRRLDPAALPEGLRDILREAQKIRTDPEGYRARLADWVRRGAASPHALSPDDVVRLSRPRPATVAEAAAHFELGAHLERAGDHAGAVRHWREAHRLDPDNWTYRRQAWELEDPGRQDARAVYGTGWYDEIRRVGAENYYPSLPL